MTNTCEGCSHEMIPGVRFATRGDGHRAIERCDTCKRYESDDEAFGRVIEKAQTRDTLITELYEALLLGLQSTLNGSPDAECSSIELAFRKSATRAILNYRAAS